LRSQFNGLRPADGTRHGERRAFIYKDLATAGSVFVRRDAPRNALEAPYDGPYAVVSRGEKVFIVHMHGESKSVSIDRLKPAYIVIENKDSEPTRPRDEPDSQNTKDNSPGQQVNTSLGQGRRSGTTTRSGRRVRFPDRFQGK